MNKICFFPRTANQVKLFKGVAELLESEGFGSIFLMPKAKKGSQPDNFPEQEVSDILEKNQIDFNAEFQRICATYKDVNRIIQSDRELNYFPFYFGDVAIDREYKINLCCAFFIVFERFILKNRPSIIVSEMVIGLIDGVLYEVARKNGIKYIGVRPSKIRQGIVFCDNPYDIPVFFDYEYGKTSDESYDLIEKNSELVIRENIKKGSLPHYMVRSKKKFRLFGLRSVKAALRVLLQKSELTKHSVIQNTKLNAFREAIYKFRNIRGWHFKQINDTQLTKDCEYFVYAAHYEPEASVHVRAFEYSDQLGLIKLLSRMMPPDGVLVIKEHRGNQGFRKANFYFEISHLYNVLIAPPNSDLRELVSQSKGVITLTGRIGLEALVDKIPVICFGNTFWSSVSEVYRPRSPKQIGTLLKKLKDRKRNSQNTGGAKANDVHRVIIAYDNCTYPGHFIQGATSFTESKNMTDYAAAILDILTKLRN